MARAITCASCGAAMRDDRAKCLRCGVPLQAPPAVSGRVVASRRGLWLTAGAVVAVIALGGYALTRSQQAPQSAPPGTQAPAAASSAASAAVVTAAASVSTEQDPLTTAIDERRAGAVAYSRGDLEAARTRYQAAVDANPGDVEALNSLAQVLVRSGQVREALPLFDRAIAAAPETWAYHFNRARAYAELMQWPQAIGGYREAARLFPDDYATEFNLAKALQASGDLPAALARYERAIVLAPGQADFHLSYGLALEASQRRADAIGAYRRYLEMEPEGPEAARVKAHIASLEGVQSSS